MYFFSNIELLLRYNFFQSFGWAYCWYHQWWLPYNTWFLELIKNHNLSQEIHLCTKIYFHVLVRQKASTKEILIFIHFYGWGRILYNNVFFSGIFLCEPKIGFVIWGQKLSFYRSSISKKIHSRVSLIWHLYCM